MRSAVEDRGNQAIDETLVAVVELHKRILVAVNGGQ